MVSIYFFYYNVVPKLIITVVLKKIIQMLVQNVMHPYLGNSKVLFVLALMVESIILFLQGYA